MSYLTEALEELKKVDLQESLLTEALLVEKLLNRRIVEDLLCEEDYVTTNAFIKMLRATLTGIGLEEFAYVVCNDQKTTIDIKKCEYSNCSEEHVEADWNSGDILIYYSVDEDAAELTYQDVIIELVKSFLGYLVSGKESTNTKQVEEFVMSYRNKYDDGPFFRDHGDGPFMEQLREPVANELRNVNLGYLNQFFGGSRNKYNGLGFTLRNEGNSVTAVNIYKYVVGKTSTIKDVVKVIKETFIDYIKSAKKPPVEDERSLGWTLADLGNNAMRRITTRHNAEMDGLRGNHRVPGMYDDY